MIFSITIVSGSSFIQPTIIGCPLCARHYARHQWNAPMERADGALHSWSLQFGQGARKQNNFSM